MQVRVQNEDRVCEGVGGIAGLEGQMGLLLVVVVELSDGVQDPGDLLGLACQEEVAGEQPDKLF